jgi:preflagellin peptidase FlaK
VLGLAVLGYGSYTDIRTRTASNSLWVAMALAGAGIMAMELLSIGSPSLLLLAPIIALAVFFCIFLEGEFLPRHMAGVVANKSVMLAIIFGSMGGIYAMSTTKDPLFPDIVMVIVMMFVFYMFYAFSLIQGGADAKALMALAILCPWYPPTDLPFVFGSVPALVTTVIPFSLSLLFNSAIMFIVVPLGLAIYNATKGDFAGMMFLGYRMRIDDIEKSFVWPMERVEGKKVVRILFPSKDRRNLSKDLDVLRRMGRKRVWVTPKMPFLVPMTLGFVVTIMFGNILLGLMLFLL